MKFVTSLRFTNNINNIKIYLIFKIFCKEVKRTLTLLHVLNYTIPIGFIIFFGFLIDRMCRPDKTKEKAGEE